MLLKSILTVEIKESIVWCGLGPAFFLLLAWRKVSGTTALHLVLSFALLKFCLLWHCKHLAAGGVYLDCAAMAPHMMRLHFITAGPQIKIRQRAWLISYGTSLQPLEAGCKTVWFVPGRNHWDPCANADLISQDDSYPIKECYNQLFPKGTKRKKRGEKKNLPHLLFPYLFTSFELQLRFFALTLFPLCWASLQPGSCYSESLQGSWRLKVSLEQSPPNVVHCAWFSSAVINPLPLLPATPEGGSTPGGIFPRPVMLRARSSWIIFEFIVTVAVETFDFSV